MMSPGMAGALAGRLRSRSFGCSQRRDRMPPERTIMRQVREVLRLKFVGGVPIREIARRIRVAASTVRATIRRFQAAGLNWPLSEGNDRCRARGQVVCRCRHEAGLL